MALVVDVPLNTMLADLDETLRVLLKRELGAPRLRRRRGRVRRAREGLVEPALGPDGQPLPLRPARVARVPPDRVGEDRAQRPHREVRPPMIMECSYAVTAWTQAVEDEHRLLSQVLAVLFAFPQLPADALAGRLAETARRFPLEGKIGQPKSDGKADFWSAVGGQYKASLDYVVTLACESGVAYERGPEVRTQTMRAADRATAPRVDDHRDAPLRRHGASTPTASRCPTPGSRCRRWGCSRRRTPGPVPARPRPARQAPARRAHARRAPRRRRRSPCPARCSTSRSAPAEARARRRAADRMGSTGCPNDCPRPSGARAPGPEKLGADAIDDSAGRASCWATSNRWSAWA